MEAAAALVLLFLRRGETSVHCSSTAVALYLTSLVAADMAVVPILVLLLLLGFMVATVPPFLRRVDASVQAFADAVAASTGAGALEVQSLLLLTLGRSPLEIFARIAVDVVAFGAALLLETVWGFVGMDAPAALVPLLLLLIVFVG